MLRHLVLFFVLLGFWVLLSGQVDLRDTHQLYLSICGVVSCALGTWLAARIGFLYDEGNVGRVAIRQITYLPWLAWQVVVSNFDVARRVWSFNPRKRIEPHLVRIPYEIESDLALAIYANSITLTPGTVTVLVDTEKKEVLVYALSKVSAAGLKDMHDRVRNLEVDR
ncbi:MAG: Na+/H+ antiporter subunit E [Planctomycetes bacterium]|nr:Na+/H+ antiporter subunit E [Planctomycetota bacterium]